MIDHIHILEQCPEFGAVVYIPAREVDIGRERIFIARREIVETPNLVSLSGKVIGEAEPRNPAAPVMRKFIVGVR